MLGEPPAPDDAGRRRAWVSGALALVCTAVLLVLTLANRPTESPLPALVTPTSASAAEAPPVGRIVFRSDRGEGYYVMDADGQSVGTLSGGEIYRNAVLRDAASPDGCCSLYAQMPGSPAYGTDLALRQIATGWTENFIQNYGEDLEPAWSPDGKYVAYASVLGDVEDIHLFDVQRRTDRLLIHHEGAPSRHPSWSPDGSELVYWTSEQGLRQLWVLTLKTGAARRISDGRHNDWDPVWIKPPLDAPAEPTPGGPEDLGMALAVQECGGDGQAVLAFQVWDSTNGRFPISRVRLEVDGRAVYDSGTLTSGWLRQTFSLGSTRAVPRVALLAWNTGGYAGQPRRVEIQSTCPPLRHLPEGLSAYLTPTPGVPQNTPVPQPTPTPLPAANFDGMILFTSNRDGDEALYLMPPEGGAAQRVQEDPNILTHYQQALKQRAVSPDGQWVAYSDYAAGRQAIFLYSAAGGWIWQLQHPAQRALDPAWAPDGAHLAYTAQNGDRSEIAVMDLLTQEERVLTNNTWEVDAHPSFSPDGGRIVFCSDRLTGKRQIWRMNADGSGLVNLSQNAFEDWDPIWIWQAAEPAP